MGQSLVTSDKPWSSAIKGPVELSAARSLWVRGHLFDRGGGGGGEWEEGWGIFWG